MNSVVKVRKLVGEMIGITISVAGQVKNLRPKQKGGKKWKGDPTSVVDEKEVVVDLLESDGTTLVDKELDNDHAWQHGYVLRIGTEHWKVCVNPPTVITLELPRCFIIGTPAVPDLRTEFTDPAKTVMNWFRLDTQRLVDPVLVSEEFLYKPDEKDVGQVLKVVCVVTSDREENMTETREAVATVSVQPLSVPATLFDSRLPFPTAHYHGDEFRLCSYNLLADVYASSKYAAEELFKQCAAEHLDVAYRQCLILDELEKINADIFCLQEVGVKQFEDTLFPYADAKGFGGLYCSKTREVREGSATLYNKRKFKLQHTLNVDVCKDFVEKQYPWLQALRKANPFMVDCMKVLSTVAQFNFFTPLDKPEKMLCIVNTHLYFHPNADCERMIQTAIILHTMEAISAEHADIEFIFCGDLNSSPDSAAIELIQNQRVSSDSYCWKRLGTAFDDKLRGADTKGQSVPITHNLALTNAYDPLPEHTNFTLGFVCTLDHIYIGPTLQAVNALPVPTKEKIQEFQALPNVSAPSDHLSLVVDLRWRK